jgi:DNA-binding NarL/FixJ family response regulator
MDGLLPLLDRLLGIFEASIELEARGQKKRRRYKKRRLSPTLQRFEEIQLHANNERREHWNELSEREQEVAKLAAQGLRNTEIAYKLTITKRTAGTHLNHVYAHLHLRNRTELANFLREIGVKLS